MDEILRTLVTPPAEGSRIFRGLIATDASGPNDRVEVRVPGYHAGRSFGPCYVTPRPFRDGSLAYPQRGDLCMIALDENEQAEIVMWWVEDPTLPQTFATRLGALESARPTLVTVLPPTPYDGQEVIYRFAQTVVPADSKVILWHLRWDVVDGAWLPMGRQEPVYAFRPDVDGASPTVNTWASISINDPSLTIPRAGDYDFEFGAGSSLLGGVTNSFLGLKFGSVEPSAGAFSPGAAAAPVVSAAQTSATWDKAGPGNWKANVAAGLVVLQRYQVQGSVTFSRGMAYIKAFPRRITG